MNREHHEPREPREPREHRGSVRCGLALAALALPAIGLVVACGRSEVQGPEDPDSITRKLLVTNAPLELGQAVEVLRRATGLSEEAARAALAALPSVVATGLSHGEADRMVRELTAAGMTTQVRRE